VNRGYKIFAALLALTLCMGANLYAERARNVGVTQTGDLSLSELQALAINSSLKPIQLNLANMTVNGVPVTRTGQTTLRTADGKQLSIERAGEKANIHFGNQTMTVFANGTTSFAGPGMAITDPRTGLPMRASGAVRLSDSDAAAPAKEAPVAGNDISTLRVASEHTADTLQSSGVPSMTVRFGGVTFPMYANGAVAFDPSLPEKILKMDSASRSLLASSHGPVSMPTFMVVDGQMVHANGSVRPTR